MTSRVRRVSFGLLFAACAALAACKSAPPPEPKPVPVTVKLSIAVSADVNPDSQKRPSPIVVRIYQLKDDAAFKAADFFALYDKEQATLAASLVAREEFELKPGEHVTPGFMLSPDTRFIGVAAAYRDIRNADWRASSGAADKGFTDLVKKDTLALALAIDRSRVTLVASQ